MRFEVLGKREVPTDYKVELSINRKNDLIFSSNKDGSEPEFINLSKVKCRVFNDAATYTDLSVLESSKNQKNTILSKDPLKRNKMPKRTIYLEGYEKFEKTRKYEEQEVRNYVLELLGKEKKAKLSFEDINKEID